MDGYPNKRDQQQTVQADLEPQQSGNDNDDDAAETDYRLQKTRILRVFHLITSNEFECAAFTLGVRLTQNNLSGVNIITMFMRVSPHANAAAIIVS